MSMPRDPDATLPVPGYGPPGTADPTMPVQPGYGGGAGGGGPRGGGPEDDWDDESDRRKLWMIAGGVLALGVLVGALIAVLASGGGDGKAASSTSSLVSTSSSSTSSSSSTTSSSTTSTTKPPTTTTAPPTTAAPAPQMLTWSATPNPVTCPMPTSTPNVTLNWSSQNAVSVTISIDNPNGPYGTYAATGSQAVPFTCSAASHTYYFVANGSGGQKSVQQQVVVNKS